MSSFNYPYRLVTGVIQRTFLLAAVIILVAACGGKTKEDVLPAGSRVVALGDNLTTEFGVSPGEAWPNLLANRTGWVVINGGVCRDTSAAALRRLPALLESHKPVLVLVAIGNSDMLRNVPQEEIIANLGRILAMIKAHGAKPVLLAIPKPSTEGARLSAADFYRKVADEQRVPLIEGAIAEVLTKTYLKSDFLHFNAAGHAQVAQKIFEDLRSIGYAS